MTVTQVNVLNIGLMVAACAAAFVAPFELFLFSYAVLGPLHYLTQISWLHSRGYFLRGRRDAILLGAAAAALLLLRFVLPLDEPGWWATGVVIVAFAGALALLAETPAVRAVTLGCALLAAAWLSGMDAAQTLFLTFVPTIIHVFLFTAAFIVYGALKGRSATGIASLLVFFACAASFFVFQPLAVAHPPSAGVRATYDLFATVNVQLAAWLGLPSLEREGAVYSSAAGVALMRFIAFAYTYHYLNWFSKTSVIQWHRIPRAWSVVNVVLWLASVALYAWDYRSGMLVLFALSWLHVVLEFPLDHRTFAGIGRELGALVRRQAVLAPARPAARHAAASAARAGARRP
jgi:hypothetical protein